MPAGESYAEYHKRIASIKISTASECARRVTDSATAKAGNTVNTSLDRITHTLQLSTAVAGSYIEDSKALFNLARALVDRVTAVEKVLGRSTEAPYIKDGVSVSSAVRNRYTADVMRVAIHTLEGCLEGYTLIAKQQTKAMMSVRVLTTSAEEFQSQVDEDLADPGSKETDNRILGLVTSYVQASEEMKEAAATFAVPPTKKKPVRKPVPEVGRTDQSSQKDSSTCLNEEKEGKIA